VIGKFQILIGDTLPRKEVNFPADVAERGRKIPKRLQ
jgi:hypothetical protein